MLMLSNVGVIFAIAAAIFGSGGIWTFIQFAIKKKTSSYKMILGLGFERLSTKCKYYIDQGHISVDEYEDLVQYLYEPYKKMGGNGTAEALMNKVANLPNAR